MRSTESSGADAMGFGVAHSKAENMLSMLAYPAKLYRAVMAQFSPVSLGIAVTALLAATLFLIYDMARTMEEARQRMQLVARSVAAELAPMPAESIDVAMMQLVAGLDLHVDAILTPPGLGYGTSTNLSLQRAAFVPASAYTTLPRLTTSVDAGELGTLEMHQDLLTAFDGVWQRGAAAFAAAFLLIGFTYRLRDPATFADQTQRKRYENLMATIPFGVACWTPSGDLIVCNQQYRERLGLSEHTARAGASYQAAVKAFVHGGYMRVVNDDDNNRIIELHREDGSCLLIDERPLADGGFVTLVTDVTERKRTDQLLDAIREEQRLLARRYHEEKLRAEAASSAKTNFLAHLSHDIRTPLNHIIGFADLIRHQTYGPLGDDRYLNYVDTIKNSGERLLSSFATILELVEMEGGQKVLREDAVDMDRLIDIVAEKYAPRAARAGLRIVVGEPCGMVMDGDAYALQRMVTNIMDNAIRFTPRGGTVTLATHTGSDGLLIEVSDTGIGMSEEKLESLSQPFVFGDSALTRVDGSTGLGIAISRAIAELSGGRMAIDSGLALGTTVAISLPVRTAAAGRRAAA